MSRRRRLLLGVEGGGDSAIVSSIGIPGTMGFGVGICPAVPAGMSEMVGTMTRGADNYGNYQYSDGSVMCWIPAFYYKYGTGANGLPVNVPDIKSFDYFSDVATANASGYALHRAFYDGGAIQYGVFVDKYQCSYNGGIASSVKNGAPLSSAAAHNPFSGLTGAPPNFYYGALAAAKTRGANFFCNSRFIFAALALLSYAHGKAATATTYCAWYDAAGTINFPKGNNNALRDINDAGIAYTSDGYPNCGLTGSGTPVAKTTHNGQACGVADLNGNMYEINPGLTCTTTTKNITGATKANPCVLTVVGHGLTTGAYARIDAVVGMTEINGKIYTVTSVDADHISLNGVDSSAFGTYTSAGTTVSGTFYALKTSVAAKNLTGGATLATDHWGATGIAANFDTIVPAFNTTYPNNTYVQRFGSGANQVLSEDSSGAAWSMTGAGLPKTAGMSPGGSNAYGLDYCYQYLADSMCPIAGGDWSSGAPAGVWLLNLSHVRGNSSAAVGFRAALYL